MAQWYSIWLEIWLWHFFMYGNSVTMTFMPIKLWERERERESGGAWGLSKRALITGEVIGHLCVGEDACQLEGLCAFKLLRAEGTMYRPHSCRGSTRAAEPIRTEPSRAERNLARRHGVMTLPTVRQLFLLCFFYFLGPWSTAGGLAYLNENRN